MMGLSYLLFFSTKEFSHNKIKTIRICIKLWDMILNSQINFYYLLLSRKPLCMPLSWITKILCKCLFLFHFVCCIKLIIVIYIWWIILECLPIKHMKKRTQIKQILPWNGHYHRKKIYYSSIEKCMIIITYAW